jgi:hypothetical protein
MSSKKKAVKKKTVAKAKRGGAKATAPAKAKSKAPAKAKATAPAKAKATAPAKAKATAPAKAKAKAPAKAKAKAPAKAKATAPAKAKATAAAKTKGKPQAAARAKAHAKAPAKAKVPAKAKAPAASAVRRRDATGHLDPKYAADLRAKSRESAEDLHVDRAFLRKSKSRERDALGEELGEEAVMTMTSAEDQSDQLQEREVEEEIGGPFVITTASQEYAAGTDRSNPQTATREPFPTT